MKRTKNNRQTVPFLILMLLAVLLLSACEEKEHPPMQLEDLSQGELLYISRLVTLERAKAVALVDRPTGDVILDSLAVAWGDSARKDTAAGLTSDPVRAHQIGLLLKRILEAESDSLIQAPRPDRLTAPLPDPPPEDPDSEEDNSQVQ